MNEKSGCLCGGECQKPCVFVKQLQQELDELKEQMENKERMKAESTFLLYPK